MKDHIACVHIQEETAQGFHDIRECHENQEIESKQACATPSLLRLLNGAVATRLLVPAMLETLKSNRGHFG